MVRSVIAATLGRRPMRMPNGTAIAVAHRKPRSTREALAPRWVSSEAL